MCVNVSGFIVTVIHKRKYSAWTKYGIFNIKESGKQRTGNCFHVNTCTRL